MTHNVAGNPPAYPLYPRPAATPPDPVTRVRQKLEALASRGTVGDLWKGHFADAPLPPHLHPVRDHLFAEVFGDYLRELVREVVRETLADDLPDAVEFLTRAGR